jgi:WD40 repeat protein
VAIAPDGTWLAVGSYDSAGSGTIRLWNADGAPRATLTGHTDWVNAVTIAPDGSWLAGAADRGHTVWIWDSVDGSLRTTLTGHTDEVRAVAIAPDGTWLAGVSDDGTVRVWDSTNSTCTTLIRLDSTLTGCAIFPDSQRLAVCGSAGITLLAYQPARHT